MAWMSEYPLRNIPDAAQSSILRRILERGGGKSVRPIKPNSFSGGCLSPFPGNVFGMSDIPRLPVKIRTDHPAKYVCTVACRSRIGAITHFEWLIGS